MKRFLIFVLILSLMMSIPVPAGALQVGDTIYVVAGEIEIDSVDAIFSDASVPPVQTTVHMTKEEDGRYSVEIPEGATTVYIFGFYKAEAGTGQADETFGGNNTKDISSLSSGDYYDVATEDWVLSGAGNNNQNQQPENNTPNEQPENNIQQGNNTTTITVSGVVGSPESDTEVISVDVTWEAMQFTYTPASQGTWNPETHQYDNTTEGSWTSDSNTITITNHSNVDVTAAFDFSAAEDLESIEGEFRNADNTAVESIDLASADNGQNGQAGSATSGSVTFHITEGSIAAPTDSLGTITVTISKK